MAQLDPSIILGAKPMQIESPVNQLAKVLEIQGMQQQRRMGEMQMQDAQNAREKQNRLAQILQSGATPESLMRGGFMAEAQAMQEAQGKAAKNTADVGKTTAETEKIRLQAGREKLGFVAQLLSGVKDQATYDQAKAMAQQNGLPIDNMPPQYDPVAIEQAKTQALTVQEQIEQVWKQKGYDLDVRKQGETERNNKTQNAISQGNLNVSRGNLALSGQRLALDQGNSVADAGGPSQIGLTKRYGKAPPGYRWKEDGTAEAIPGGPQDIKAGEAGAKAQGRRDAASLAAGNVLSAVSDAKKLVGMNTTGPGSLLSKVPGTDARDLQAKLDTVKANLGFDRLQQMREMSPTGGALGAVAVQELIALQSTVASLDQAQSANELTKSLEKIEGHYNKWLKTVNSAGGDPESPGNVNQKGVPSSDAIEAELKRRAAARGGK